jgi:uncharacterized membrane protein YhaH (DUF805 family)
MKKLIKNNIQGWKVLVSFILANVVYVYMLIVSIPKVMSFSNGMKILDMMPGGYDSAYVNLLFNTLGKTGRDMYLYHQIPVDMIYPLLFIISYTLLLAFFLKKLEKLDTGLFFLCLLPLVAGIADYLENIAIITMLKHYPDLSDTQILMANIFSTTKSITTTLYFIILILVVIVLGIRLVKTKRQ